MVDTDFLNALDLPPSRGKCLRNKLRNTLPRRIRREWETISDDLAIKEKKRGEKRESKATQDASNPFNMTKRTSTTMRVIDSGAKCTRGNNKRPGISPVIVMGGANEKEKEGDRVCQVRNIIIVDSCCGAGRGSCS